MILQRSALAVLLLLPGVPFAAPAAQGADIVPGRVVLKPAAGALADLHERLAAVGLDGTLTPTLPAPRRADRVGVGRIRTLFVAPGAEAGVAARLDALPWIDWASPLRGGGGVTGGPPAAPSDPFFPQQWTLSQPNDVDMDAPEAWLLRGTYHADPTLVVAVIDTGIDFVPPNPDLANLWANPGEIVNGLDDDGNGFVDDVSGYDFVKDDGNPDDEHSHGTGVTAILGGVTDNGHEIAGVASGVRWMQLKAFDADGDFPASGPYAGTASAAAALVYATDEQADLVNNSWGVFTGFDQLVFDAVAYALDHDVRLVFGAGNSDTTTFFPAELPGVIAVAAIDSAGKKSEWGGGSGSCFGPWVDVCAGGTGVLAPGLDGLMFSFDGTSAAAPNAGGVAALALSEAPNLSSEDLRQVLRQGAVPVDALNPGFAGLLGAGHVNARGALGLLSHTTDLGGGLAGSTAPALNAWGTVQPGAVLTASLSRLPPGAPSGLAVGTGASFLPFFGGTLAPTPTLVLLGFADPTGRLAWSAVLPGGLPAGAILFLQGGALDAGAPQGVSISNALAYTGG